MDWINYLYLPCENAPKPGDLVRIGQAAGFTLADPVAGRIRAFRFNDTTLDFDPCDVANLAELDDLGAESNLGVTLRYDGAPLTVYLDPRRVVTAPLHEPAGLGTLPCLGHIWFSLGVMSMTKDPAVSRLPEAVIALFKALCRQTGAVYGLSAPEIALEYGPTTVDALHAVLAGRAPGGLFWMTFIREVAARHLDFGYLSTVGARVETLGAGTLIRLSEEPRAPVQMDPGRMYAEWMRASGTRS